MNASPKELFPSCARLRRRAMTLLEVMFALGVFSLIMLGILRAFLQAQRLNEGSVYQTTALTVVAGYMEQLKSMPLAGLVSSNPVQTNYDNYTVDNLTVSSGTPPTVTIYPPSITLSNGTNVPLGTTPAGVGIVDNLRSFDMSTSTTNTTILGLAAFTNGASPSSWTNIWPGATTYPTSTLAVGATPAGPPYDYSTRCPDNNDLHLNLWIWVQDVSTGGTANSIYRITIIYTYQFVDGGRVRYQLGEMTDLRSAVPTVQSPRPGA